MQLGVLAVVMVQKPSAIWSSRQAVIVAAIVGSTSAVGLWGIVTIYPAPFMPDWLFLSLFLGVGGGYPIASVGIFYKRQPRATLALFYGLGLGIGWHITIWSIEIAESGPWHGLQGEHRTLLSFVGQQLMYFLVTIAITIGMAMIVWGLCRLLRGKIFLQDGTVCTTCAYNLTGNTSGVCPECGVKIQND